MLAVPRHSPLSRFQRSLPRKHVQDNSSIPPFARDETTNLEEKYGPFESILVQKFINVDIHTFLELVFPLGVRRNARRSGDTETGTPRFSCYCFEYLVQFFNLTVL